MLLWTLLPVALAAPPGADAHGAGHCADVAAQVEVAWTAYNEAELERAKALLAEAYASLGCQRVVVPSEALLELYRLDALVSLTQEDTKGAVYATIRAVAVDPVQAAPPPEYGPELAELYDTWSSRLGETLVTIAVEDGGAAWIDGRRVLHGAPLSVVEGEHLVQIEGVAGLTSELRELSTDLDLTTGVPVAAGADARPPSDGPQGAVGRSRRRPASFVVGGALGAAAGGVALASAWQREARFLGADYQAPRYGGCERGTRCYENARLDRISGDARLVRGLYVGGYALTGVGALLLGVGVVGLPVHTDGRTVSVDLRW